MNEILFLKKPKKQRKKKKHKESNNTAADIDYRDEHSPNERRRRTQPDRHRDICPQLSFVRFELFQNKRKKKTNTKVCGNAARNSDNNRN